MACDLHTQRERQDAQVYLIGLSVASTHTQTQDAQVYLIGLAVAYTHKERHKTQMLIDLAEAFTQRERRKTHRFTRLACDLHTQRETQDAKVHSIGL